MTHIAQLTDRSVLELRGGDVRAFLQDMLTNDIDQLAPATPLWAALLSAQGRKPVTDEAAVMANAKAVHAAVLSIDTHVDIAPTNFTASGPNYTQKLPRTQVDLAKMEEGGLGGAFLVVYVGQSPKLDAEGFASANAQALEKFDAIHRLTEELAPSRSEIAYTAADARRIHAAGKRVIFIGVENGFPIGADITNVKKFFDRGGRYMSLAHNGHSQLSDSNTGERDGVWLHNGLSPLGKQVIVEMNRLGMMIDVSHPSKQSMLQTIAISKAPIIASHSGVRAICNHSRNMDDEQLTALKKNGGVIQLVAFNSYVKCDPTRDLPREQARAAAMTDLPDDGWLQFLCVEAAQVGEPIHIGPGEEFISPPDQIHSVAFCGFGEVVAHWPEQQTSDLNIRIYQ